MQQFNLLIHKWENYAENICDLLLCEFEFQIGEKKKLENLINEHW